MRSYRFLLSARWLGFAAFALALSAVCIQMGLWQFHRLHERLDHNKVIEKHLAADPKPLDDVIPQGSAVSKNQEWTRVSATGTFMPDKEITVKFRARNNSPGVDVVTPLLLEDGTAIAVDRGWMAAPNTSQRPDNIPPPPDGEVTIVGWIRPDNGAGASAVDVHEGQVRAIASTGLSKYVGVDMRRGYIDQTAPVNDALEPEPEPERGQGPHFFYALQWWFFAGLAIVGYFYFAYAENKDNRMSGKADQVKVVV